MLFVDVDVDADINVEVDFDVHVHVHVGVVVDDDALVITVGVVRGSHLWEVVAVKRLKR